MRIVGAWSGHDAAWSVLEADGTFSEHVELERLTREKECAGDSLAASQLDPADFGAVATCFATSNVTARPSWRRWASLPLHAVGHHEAHAADARYSSDFPSCAIAVVDGGGYDDDAGTTVATSVWAAPDASTLTRVWSEPERELNLGGLWTRATRYVFGLESGWPQGHQAGSVMAMAALGDPTRYADRFRSALTTARRQALRAPAGHVKGMSAADPKRPRHPYWGDLEDEVRASDQARFDAAAALQLVTEEVLLVIVERAAAVSSNVCLAGGVMLNCVFVGKLAEARPDLALFVPPVPYDAGLARGAALHALHVVGGVPWIPGAAGSTAYLGRQYSRADVDAALSARASEIDVSPADDHTLIESLHRGDVVSVFRGRAEAGRRALGNRSIFADPRSASAKDRVNARVKHRQSYRPFAPVIQRHRVSEWFVADVSSPYMSFAVHVRPGKREQIPAVVHADGTARLQTLFPQQNAWLDGVLDLWCAKTGVPILLNTSYNDREPIVETPAQALDCFLRTDIDALWLPEYGLRVTKRCP